MKWINTKDDLPQTHERVLAVLNGEIIVLELQEEYPTHEEPFFKPLYYWHEPFDECIQIEWEEVTYWTHLPEIPKPREI